MKPMPPLLEAMGVVDDPKPTLPEGWTDRATEALKAALSKGLMVCAEDIRQAAEASGLPPAPDGRAWGSVFSRAKRKGLLTYVGRSHRYMGKPPRPRLVSFWKAA